MFKKMFRNKNARDLQVINYQLKMLAIKVLALNTVSFLLISIAGVMYTNSLKTALSEQIGISIGRNIVTGDLRQGILDAKRQASRQFLAVGYFRQERLVFTFPTEKSINWGEFSGFFSSLRFGKLQQPIFLDDSGKQRAGDLQFVYNRLEAFPLITLVWALLSVILFLFFHASRRDLIRLQQREIEHERVTSLANMATQVAHDIRSPLAALDTVVSGIKSLPEDQRIMVRSAVNRIKDIANNLIEKNRKPVAAACASEGAQFIEAASLQLLSSLVEPLISEKRLQFRSKMGVEIDSSVDGSSYGLFAKIQPVEFKRVLSNLVNNAVEALVDQGSVRVALTKHNDRVDITVSDNGNGIPPEVLVKLGKRGETHGKAGGSGLGLYHARTTVESWGGNLEIASDVGNGTKVTITLPLQPAPDWFVSEVKLTPSTAVVILDDDASIHGVWDQRMNEVSVQAKAIQVVHLSNPDDFRKWVDGNRGAARQALFLVDFELLGFKDTGLDLIRTYNLGSQSILVTSRFEEKAIRDGCANLGVRLIPKGMAGFVPISFQQPLETWDYVLLDNDELVRQTWAFSAGGRKVLSFSQPEQFKAYLPRLKKNCPIYIDSGLDDGIKGEDVAKEIAAAGFSNVWLCTGYPAEQFLHLTYLAGVQGKEAPWIKID